MLIDLPGPIPDRQKGWDQDTVSNTKTSPAWASVPKSNTPAAAAKPKKSAKGHVGNHQHPWTNHKTQKQTPQNHRRINKKHNNKPTPIQKTSNNRSKMIQTNHENVELQRTPIQNMFSKTPTPVTPLCVPNRQPQRNPQRQWAPNVLRGRLANWRTGRNGLVETGEVGDCFGLVGLLRF